MASRDPSPSLFSAEAALQAGSVSWMEWVEKQGQAEAVLALEGRLDFFHWRAVASRLPAGEMRPALVERLLKEGRGAFALMLAERRELASEVHARLALWTAEMIAGGWAKGRGQGEEEHPATVAPGMGLVVQRLLRGGALPEAERGRLLASLRVRGKRALGPYLTNAELLRSANPAPAEWLVEVACTLEGRESPLVATLVSHPSADATVWVAVIRSRIHRSTLEEVLIAHRHVLGHRAVREALREYPMGSGRFVQALIPHCEGEEALPYLRYLLRHNARGSLSFLLTLDEERLHLLGPQELEPLLSHGEARVRLAGISLLGRLSPSAEAPVRVQKGRDAPSTPSPLRNR